MDIEQPTLIWITRLVFIIITVLIGYSVWVFMRRERVVIVPLRKPYQPPANIELPEKNIALTVMAKPGRVFDSVKLFKTLEDLGFQHAENQAFEYFIPNSNHIAFSLINIRSPHQFSTIPQEMPPTNGLVAIMQLPIADGDDQVSYFHLLLSVLDELCNHLDAELCSTTRAPIKNAAIYDMQKEIELFEQSYTSKIQHDYQHRDA